MIPKEPTAQRSSAPPVNMLYIPSRPSADCALFLKNSANACPSKPGMGIIDTTRHSARTTKVKIIRSFNSGILKQLAKVLRIDFTMTQITWAANVLGLNRSLHGNQFTGSTQTLNRRASLRTKPVGHHDQLAGQFAIAQYLDPGRPAIRQPQRAQRDLVNPRTLFKLIQRRQIHRNINRRMADVIKPPFRQPSDERHLSAFKPRTNGTAGPGRLPFATPAAGLAMTAGLTLTEAFAAVFGTVSRF